jgi:hypothetical protein
MTTSPIQEVLQYFIRHSLVVYKSSVRELLDGRHGNHSRDICLWKGDHDAIDVLTETTHHGRRGHEGISRIANAFKRVGIVQWQILDARQDEFLVYLLGQWLRCFLEGRELSVNHCN